MAKNSINIPDRAKLKGYEITFKNFSGRETQYNRAGNRNFAIVLDDDTADQMLKDGWNVRVKEYDDGTRRNTLSIAVRFDIERYCPIVVMVTPKGNYFKKTTLNEDTVGELDSARIIKADVVLNPSPWRSAMGGSGVKAYLDTGYFIIEKDEFEDDYPEEDDVLEGIEVVDEEETPF